MTKTVKVVRVQSGYLDYRVGACDRSFGDVSTGGVLSAIALVGCGCDRTFCDESVGGVLSAIVLLG
ncbi:hypothetical protein [Argonema galeatum]|uniref:hypothetical protein n=1 Tax=Argonema galeatum TaxID=2942762 RepID=UPI002012C48F|nr:hypothetical protein [Argonema galeatum]MCL1466113.1 hypothetical protein [Argonema galeatum A003/A1]